jgi:hypothetical protein
MAENKVPAENGVTIGISGFDKLCCPKCGEPLGWVEHREDGIVKMTDGVLKPAYEEKLVMGRASPKEAYCCGIYFTATPWAHFLITATEDDT